MLAFLPAVSAQETPESFTNDKGEVWYRYADGAWIPKIHADSSDLFLQGGNEKWQRGDVAGAHADAERAVRLNSRNALAFVLRGLTRQEAERDYDGAMADYDRAITLDPRNDLAFTNRGWARHQLGDLKAAVADYDRAIGLNPRNDLAFTNRGWARHQLGDLKAAVADYDRAIALNPKNALAFTNRGWARHRQGDQAGALADYRQAIALDPRNDLALTNRGVLKAENGDVDGALRDFNAALQINPANDLARQNRHRLKPEQTAATGPANGDPAPPVVGGKTAGPEQDLQAKGAEEAPPTVWLVAVGIGTYQQDHMFGASLDFTVPGMYEFVRMVERRDLSRERPVVLTESGARRQAILSALRDLTDPAKVRPQDMVVFFYSGHGLMAGRTIGICPYDYSNPANLITDEDITEILQKSPARHKICFIEACKSAAMMGPAVEAGTLESFNRRRRDIRSGLAFITSTRAGYPSWGENGKGGYFTQYLLEGLDQGLADADRDRIVTVEEIFTYVQARVSRRTSDQQVPEINAGGYDRKMPVMVLPK